MTSRTIAHSDLSDRRIIDQQTAEEMGRVAELWLDPSTHQILGFSCKAGLLGLRRQSYDWAQIESIGEDSVIVQALTEAAPAPPKGIESIVGGEVWTAAGDLAGKLVDYQIDLETGDVLEYWFVSDGVLGGLADGIYRLPAEAIVSMTHRRILVETAAINEAALVSAGLTQKVHQLADFFKQDYARTRQDLHTLIQGTQGISQQLRSATQKATESVVDLTDHLQNRTEEITEQAKLKATQIAGQLQSATEARMEPIKQITTDTTEKPETGQLPEENQSFTVDTNSKEI